MPNEATRHESFRSLLQRGILVRYRFAPEKRTQNSSGNFFLVSSNSRLASARESLSVETSFGDGDRFSTLASRTAAMKAAARNTAKPARIGFPSVSSRWNATPE